VLEVLSYGAWCGCDLCDGGVEEMLSLWRLLPESLAQSEAVGEGRPPRRVARISGRPCVVTGVCARAFLDRRERRLCVCSSRVTIPWWRSSGGCSGLQWVAPLAFLCYGEA
jgi:hypothetical protein